MKKLCQLIDNLKKLNQIDWCFSVNLEQGERMTAHDPLQKEMATEKKEAKIHEAERRKHEERRHNAAVADHGGHAVGGGVLGGHDQHHAGGGVLGGHKHTTGTHPTGTDYTGTGYGTGGTY